MRKQDLTGNNPNVVSNKFVPEPGDFTDYQVKTKEYLENLMTIIREGPPKFNASEPVMQHLNCLWSRLNKACIESVPEPGEFTKKARMFLPPKEVFDKIDLMDVSEQPGQLEIFLHQACERLDSLQAELSATQLELGAADKEIERMKEALECALSSFKQRLTCGKGDDPQTELDMIVSFIEETLKGEPK